MRRQARPVIELWASEAKVRSLRIRFQRFAAALMSVPDPPSSLRFSAPPMNIISSMVHSSAGPAALPLFKRATEIDPKFAMAHAFLGGTYGESGESDLAAQSTITAYQDFLTLWKDADPDVPVLTQAKTEYVKLQ